MASLTRWTRVWVNSGIWWWTGRPGVLWFIGSPRVGHDWATELNCEIWGNNGNSDRIYFGGLQNHCCIEYNQSDFGVDHLVMSMCRVLSCVVGNSVSLRPASFCIPRPNLPVTPGISWLLTFAFPSPIMKRTSFGVFVLEGLEGLNRTTQLQLLQH